MGSTKFTEGSWRVEWDTDEEGGGSFDVLKSDGDVDDDGRMVDASYSIIEMAYGVLGEEKNRANANLIAAAPDLYDALARLRLMMATRGDWGAGHQMGYLRDACRRAEMALAYARGEAYRWSDDDEEWGPDTATQQLERGPR
jgi:hypothetical protein